MLSEYLDRAVNRAYQQAREERHELLTLEHLLLSFLEEEEVREVLLRLGVRLEVLRGDLLGHLSEHGVKRPEGETVNTHPTLLFQRVMQRSVLRARNLAKENRKVEVSCVMVLFSILGEAESYASYFLKKQGVTHASLKAILEEDKKEDKDAVDDKKEALERSKEQKYLIQFTQNLNERAQLGKIDPLIGRDKEIERMMQVLCRRRKNNPLILGDAGVGKTAVVEGLAKRIVDGDVPLAMRDVVIYRLDIAGLLAGTKYRGDFENRVKVLIKALAEEKHAVLFIDDIHTIIGAGSSGNSAMDASSLLKPALASGELHCIGVSTYQDYRRIFEKDQALVRRFQRVELFEPSLEDSVEILHGLKERYELFHKVRYLDEALEAAVHLSARHLHERALPDKAIDLLDEAGARLRLHADAVQKVVDAEMIEALIANIAKIPEQSVSKDDRHALRYLERDLKTVVFGQDEAISHLSDAIKLSRSGLRESEKPIGSFLFAGPTGVGKTEVCRQLAHVLGLSLLRFDMSEYMEAHAVSRLIGAPPGYVGFEKAGLLTEKVQKTPHAVLLFDEIEKAHPDIMNILLQMMDHGILTDSNGREVNCRHLVIVMTSNVGAFELEKSGIGFSNQGKADYAIHRVDEAIKRAFSPEFRNRLDAIIHFAPLQVESVRHIVDKFMIELEAQLEARQITLSLSEKAKSWLIEKGYDSKMGARPMARLIQRTIKQPLAEELLFGSLAENGGHVHIELGEDGLILQYESALSDKTHLLETP